MPPRRDDGAGPPPDAEAHACRRACPWKTNVVMCASDRLEGEGNSSNVSSSLPAPAARRTPPGRHLLVTRQPRRRLRDRFPTCGGSPGSMAEERVSSKYASLLRKFEASRVFSRRQETGRDQIGAENGLKPAWTPRLPGPDEGRPSATSLAASRVDHPLARPQRTGTLVPQSCSPRAAREVWAISPDQADRAGRTRETGGGTAAEPTAPLASGPSGPR